MGLLDRGFLELLEFRISGTLSRSEDPATRYLWCDGVLPPLFDLDERALRKHLHDRRRIELQAFVGADGQGRWTLVLHLGSRSVSRLARGLDLVPCVPDEEESWLVVRSAEREIDAHLR